MTDAVAAQQRAELHKTIWSIADDLRGSVDGWDFKQYVLGVMFYRYISENLTNYINEGERAAGDAAFDYAKMPDALAEGARAGLVQEKGFFILPSELFCNVLARAKDDENLNETLERVFNNIEDSIITRATISSGGVVDLGYIKEITEINTTVSCKVED